MLYVAIKHSEVEEQYTKEKLEAFYSKVRQDLIEILFDDPYAEVCLSDYFRIDDKGYPVPHEFVERKLQDSIVRVLDYSVIEDLV